MSRWILRRGTSDRAHNAVTKLRDEIGSLAAAFGSTAADLKDNQDKLLTYGRGLETLISERTAELAQEKANLEANVAERTAQLSAANDELRSQAAELSKRTQEIVLFSKMSDFLQTSTTEAEAYSVISDVVTQLFPDDSGAVFVLNASRNMLEAGFFRYLTKPIKVVEFLETLDIALALAEQDTAHSA